MLSWAGFAGSRSGENPTGWWGNLSEILPKQGGAVMYFPALPLDIAPDGSVIKCCNEAVLPLFNSTGCGLKSKMKANEMEMPINGRFRAFACSAHSNGTDYGRRNIPN